MDGRWLKFSDTKSGFLFRASLALLEDFALNFTITREDGDAEPLGEDLAVNVSWGDDFAVLEPGLTSVCELLPGPSLFEWLSSMVGVRLPRLGDCFWLNKM